MRLYVYLYDGYYRFYVGCDRCQDWFHCECVGITQQEADALDSYICPNCQKKDEEDPINQKELTDRDYDLLFKLIRNLQVSGDCSLSKSKAQVLKLIRNKMKQL